MSGALGFNKSKQRTTTPDMQAQEFKNLRSPFAKALQGLLGTQGDHLSGIPQSQASQTGYAAPVGANEQALLDQLAAEGGQRNQLLNDTLSGKFVDAGNPFTQQAIAAAQRPTQEAFEQSVGRVLPGQFSQAGHRTQPGQSSPFDTAAAIQSRGLANALGDIATNISFGAHEAERGRQQEAITFSQQEVDTSIKNLQAQALPRLIEQYGLDQGLAEFQQRTQQLMELLAILGGVTAPALGQKSKGDEFGFKTSGGMSATAPSI